jgi:hypothetical protein
MACDWITVIDVPNNKNAALWISTSGDPFEIFLIRLLTNENECCCADTIGRMLSALSFARATGCQRGASGGISPGLNGELHPSDANTPNPFH